MTPSDRRWQAAAEELAPAKSLARVDERARQVVTGVSLVGTVITGLGLVAGAQLTNPGPARVLAVGAVCLAVLAVVTALGTLLLRFPRRVRPGDLDDVQRFFVGQFRRAYGVVVAGVLLLLALLVAAAAAVVVLATGERVAAPGLSVTVVGAGAEAKLTLRAEIPSVPVGGAVRAEVVGTPASGPRTVLARQVITTREAGTVTVVLDAVPVGGYATVDVLAESPTRRCTATLHPTAPDDVPPTTCVRR